MQFDKITGLYFLAENLDDKYRHVTMSNHKSKKNMYTWGTGKKERITNLPKVTTSISSVTMFSVEPTRHSAKCECLQI